MVSPGKAPVSVASGILSCGCALSCAFLLQTHAAAGPEELCEVAGYLGRADPWYESNINTLCHMIPKLATMVRGNLPTSTVLPEPGPFPKPLRHPGMSSCLQSPIWRLSFFQQPGMVQVADCPSPQAPFAAMCFFGQGTGNGRFQKSKCK